jgi:DNA-binding response OmpR family regulator
MMPGFDGRQAIEAVRSARNQLRILMPTSKSSCRETGLEENQQEAAPRASSVRNLT